MIRHSRRQNAALAAAAIIAAVTLAAAFFGIRHDQATICRVAQHNTATLRNLLLLAQSNSRVTLKYDPAKLQRSQQFYRQALGLLEPVDCNHI